jgi:hypothetical protein
VSVSITLIVENGAIKLPMHVPDGTAVEVSVPEPPQPVQRKFGLHPGAWVVADDFDDELPEQFWAPDEK